MRGILGGTVNIVIIVVAYILSCCNTLYSNHESTQKATPYFLHPRFPLHEAVRQSHATFEKICTTVRDINQPDEQGKTALHVAAERGNVDVVQCLLDLSARLQQPAQPAQQQWDSPLDIHIRDLYRRTPLMLAHEYGHVRVINVLLTHQTTSSHRSQLMDEWDEILRIQSNTPSSNRQSPRPVSSFQYLTPPLRTSPRDRVRTGPLPPLPVIKNSTTRIVPIVPQLRIQTEDHSGVAPNIVISPELATDDSARVSTIHMPSLATDRPVVIQVQSPRSPRERSPASNGLIAPQLNPQSTQSQPPPKLPGQPLPQQFSQGIQVPVNLQANQQHTGYPRTTIINSYTDPHTPAHDGNLPAVGRNIFKLLCTLLAISVITVVIVYSTRTAHS